MRQAFQDWDELAADVRAAYKYPHSKWASGNIDEALEEAWAETFAFYMNGQVGLIKNFNVEIADLFADATRRLQYVPIKRTGSRSAKKATDWFFKDTDVRRSTPNFAPIERDSLRWIQNLTNRERELVRRYTGSSASVWNGEIARGRFSKAARELQDALLRAKQKEPVYSWRLVPSRAAKDVRAELDRALRNNGTFVHKTFASTTTKPGSYGSYSNGGVVLEIKSKTGAFIRSVSSYSSENEFLIPAGRKYRVVGRKEVQFQSTGYGGGTIRSWVYQIEEI
jgi:hypothetical protein